MEIRQKSCDPRVPPLRSFKVIGTDRDQAGTGYYGFLLTLHSNHGPIMYRLQDIASYWPKIAIFFLTKFN